MNRGKASTSISIRKRNIFLLLTLALASSQFIRTFSCAYLCAYACVARVNQPLHVTADKDPPPHPHFVSTWIRETNALFRLKLALTLKIHHASLQTLCADLWRRFPEQFRQRFIILSIKNENSTQLPRDHSVPAQPISTRKPQSRQKGHKPLRTSWISQTDVSAMFDNHKIVLFSLENKRIFHMLSLRDLRFTHVFLTYYVRKGSLAFLS